MIAPLSSAFIKLFLFFWQQNLGHMVFSNLLLQTDRSDTYETELVNHVLDWWNDENARGAGLVMERMEKSSFAFDRLGEGALFRSISYYFGNMHKCINITIKWISEMGNWALWIIGCKTHHHNHKIIWKMENWLLRIHGSQWKAQMIEGLSSSYDRWLCDDNSPDKLHK